MALSRLVSLILRGAELVFAAIVAGVNGEYLHQTHTTAWRFVYTEVVSGLAIFFALIWLIPFSSTFTHWWLDLIISILWWVSFGVLAAVSSSFAPFPRASYTCIAKKKKKKKEGGIVEMLQSFY
jgi:hypothetical protein